MLMTRNRLTLVGALFLLCSLVAIGTYNYGWNISALIHIDVPFAKEHKLPPGLVLYQDSAYDGEAYYQIARDIPALMKGEPTSFKSAYRFQRIIYPLFTYVLSLGNEHHFPLAMLGINIVASLFGLLIMFKITRGRILHTLTILLNPAILVGILFSLTEPLSLFFIILFFYCWERAGKKIDILSLVPLTVSLFARETTIFLIVLMILWMLWHKRWKECLLLFIPVFLLFLWNKFLFTQFEAVSFQASGQIMNVTIRGPRYLILWLFEGINSYRLSSLALLAFLLPLLVIVAREWKEKRLRIGFYTFLLTGLSFTMLSMDPHMWGVITSIGRVVTPFYPVYTLYATEQDTVALRGLSLWLIVLSCIAAVGIALTPHPFVVSSI